MPEHNFLTFAFILTRPDIIDSLGARVAISVLTGRTDDIDNFKNSLATPRA